jgi:mannan endo-1,4-beta-mannosidase
MNGLVPLMVRSRMTGSMRDHFTHCVALCALLFITHTSSAQFAHFVKVHGDKLMDGESELRFISFNIPNLHYIEDNQAFTDPNPWRPANEFEIRDALMTIKHLGGNVTRLYTPSVRKANDDVHIIRHVEGPGTFNEEAFKAYDRVLQIANEVGVRVIIPFVDNWWWWGGIADYARFRGKPKEAFWTDSVVIWDFKNTVKFIVNRINTYTGVPYNEDKALLGWETGNELEVPNFAWTKEIAAFVKSLDRNHLVIEGTHSQVILDEAVTDPNIDVLSTHYYKPAHQLVTLMHDARQKAKWKKPYFVGEFGFMPTDSMRVVLDSVISSVVSGIMGWSLRQHNRDGGFYYHGAAYRWPGFESGAAWDEQSVIRLFREKAYQINGVAPPPVPVPSPPRLLPIETPYKISWQGSAGASSYTVERGSTWLFFFRRWSVIDSNASDAQIGYRPLFADTSAEPGVAYSYRIRARNSSGISEPSEASGSVRAPYRLLVDEFENSDRMFERSPDVTHTVGWDATRAKEDRSRVEGTTGQYIVYRLPRRMMTVQLDAFFTTANRDSGLSFSSGSSPELRIPLPAKSELFEVYKNEYKAYCPVRYSIREIPAGHRYLRIDLIKGIQLGRLEIGYDAE